LSDQLRLGIEELRETTSTDFRALYTHECSDPTRRLQLQILFTAPVPEPASIVLFTLGILCVSPLLRRGIQ
jgi:hypothetical protein